MTYKVSFYRLIKQHFSPLTSPLFESFFTHYPLRPSSPARSSVMHNPSHRHRRINLPSCTTHHTVIPASPHRHPRLTTPSSPARPGISPTRCPIKSGMTNKPRMTNKHKKCLPETGRHSVSISLETKDSQSVLLLLQPLQQSPLCCPRKGFRVKN